MLLYLFQDVFEAQKECCEVNARVIIVDDLLATGGTMAAAYNLMENEIKADVLECMVLIELSDLGGRAHVPGKVKSFLQYNDQREIHYNQVKVVN